MELATFRNTRIGMYATVRKFGPLFTVTEYDDAFGTMCGYTKRFTSMKDATAHCFKLGFNQGVRDSALSGR